MIFFFLIFLQKNRKLIFHWNLMALKADTSHRLDYNICFLLCCDYCDSYSNKNTLTRSSGGLSLALCRSFYGVTSEIAQTLAPTLEVFWRIGRHNNVACGHFCLFPSEWNSQESEWNSQETLVIPKIGSILYHLSRDYNNILIEELFWIQNDSKLG